MLVDETVKAPRVEWRFGEVVAVVAETTAVKSLVLRVPGWPGHKPGQHVDVRLTAEDGYQAQRSYSIASAPEQGALEQGGSGVGAPDETNAAPVTLTVERLADGEVSPFLTDEVRVGDRLELRGPIGGYFTWTVADGGPLFLVAGGSGIVPLMAMLRHRALAHAAGSAVPAVLLYSSRSYADVIYRDELARLAGAGDGLKVVHTLTRGAPPGWEGYSRRIDRAMLAEVAPDPALRPLVYVCGPTPLVESVANTLVELGHDPLRIKTERFGPTG
ncbi:MAG: ferredoxin reductase [Caldilineaceae bacterium]